eukprot:gene25235-11043_t
MVVRIYDSTAGAWGNADAQTGAEANPWCSSPDGTGAVGDGDFFVEAAADTGVLLAVFIAGDTSEKTPRLSSVPPSAGSASPPGDDLAPSRKGSAPDLGLFAPPKLEDELDLADAASNATPGSQVEFVRFDLGIGIIVAHLVPTQGEVGLAHLGVGGLFRAGDRVLFRDGAGEAWIAGKVGSVPGRPKFPIALGGECYWWAEVVHADDHRRTSSSTSSARAGTAVGPGQQAPPTPGDAIRGMLDAFPEITKVETVVMGDDDTDTAASPGAAGGEARTGRAMGNDDRAAAPEQQSAAQKAPAAPSLVAVTLFRRPGEQIRQDRGEAAAWGVELDQATMVMVGCCPQSVAARTDALQRC